MLDPLHKHVNGNALYSAAEPGVGQPSGHARSRTPITRFGATQAATLVTRLPPIGEDRLVVTEVLASIHR
jgi:hypothetical protein